MLSIKTCFIKINLTLRVLCRRDDGYHDVVSTYMRLPSPEVLRIATQPAGEDEVWVHGMEIPGDPKRNILFATCAALRSIAPAMPPLRMDLYKHLPAGSGLGAGSGNAAALIHWFERSVYAGGRRVGVWSAVRLGADVAFLASGNDLLLAEGVGEELRPFGDAPDLLPVIFFPRWRSDTAEAYAAVDCLRAGGSATITAGRDAVSEASAVLQGLRMGSKIGLLPNDFIHCMKPWQSCYNSLYKALDDCGAVAWGLCGSGSSSFALFERSGAAERLARLDEKLGSGCGFDWLEQTLVAE